jgi:hypothetical protein
VNVIFNSKSHVVEITGHLVFPMVSPACVLDSHSAHGIAEFALRSSWNDDTQSQTPRRKAALPWNARGLRGSLGHSAAAGAADQLCARTAMNKDVRAIKSVCFDLKLRMNSFEPCDFFLFLAHPPRIKLICFNRQPAERIFRQKSLPPSADGVAPGAK